MDHKVSICMPNYNFAQYLPEAIESVLRQSYSDFEFVIIDNCSTDNSVEVIQHYAEKDARIKLNVNKQNIGLVNNLNLCLQKAHGDYIKFLFSDDLLASEKALEQMVTVLDAHEGISLVASARNVIDYQSAILKIWSEYKGKIGYSGTKIIQDCLLEQKNKIGEPSVVMFRKKHVGTGFDTRYRQAVDLALWFHILEQGDFAYLEEPLCSFRMHPGQQTKINAERNDLCDEPFQLIEDYAGKPYIHLSRIRREYMKYVPVYAVWKLHKKRKITFSTAIDKIKQHYNLNKFYLLLPFYKMYKFLRSMNKS